MSSLRSSEWFIVYFFLILLASIVVISHISHRKVQRLLEEIGPAKARQVEILGEIERPGVYEMREFSTVAEALKKAKPKRFADLSELNLTAIAPAVIEVPRLTVLRVFITGNGVKEPIHLLVEPQTRICQLKSKVLFNEDADLSVFRSRKMVSDGEEIQVGKRGCK